MRLPVPFLSSVAVFFGLSLGMPAVHSRAEQQPGAEKSEASSETQADVAAEAKPDAHASAPPAKRGDDGYAYVRQQLNTFVDLDYDGKPFVALVSELAKLLRVDIVVDGIDGKCSGVPVNLHLDHCRAKIALKQALRQVDENLAFVVRDGYLLLTTREKCDTQFEARVYLASQLPRISTSGLPVGGYPGPLAADQVRLDEFRQLFTVVEPLSWETSGGQGRLAYVNGNVIVWQSPRIHDLIADLLEELQRVDEQDGPAAEPLSPVIAPASLQTGPALPVPAAPSSLSDN